MKIVDTSNSEHYKWGDNCDGWHLLKNNQLSVIEEIVPSGSSEVLHYHSLSQQFFYIKSGIATIEVDGNIQKLSANQGINIPANTPHKFMNTDTEPTVFLVISTPPSHGDRTNL
ncbi:MAG: cupin domain-containing protein [Fibrobacterales bacterium]